MKDPFNSFVAFGAELDAYLEWAKRTCPPDRWRLIESHAAKMLATTQRLGEQLAVCVNHVDKCKPVGNLRHFTRAKRRG